MQNVITLIMSLSGQRIKLSKTERSPTIIPSGEVTEKPRQS